MEFVTNFYFFSQIFWHWRTDVCLNLRLHTYLRGDLSWRIKNIPPREGARSHPVQRRNGLPCTPKTEKKLPGTLLQQNPNRPEFPVSRKLPGLPGQDPGKRKLPGLPEQLPEKRKLPGLPERPPVSRKLLTACPAHPTGSAQKANIRRKGNMFPERPTGISAGNLLYSRQPEFFFFSGLLFFCPWPFYIWNLFSTSIWDFR